MLTKYGRMFFAAIAFAMSIFWMMKELYLPASAMLIGVGFIVYGYMKYGTVYLAFRQLRSGKLADAEKTLNQIKDRNKLNEEHRAYFHFVWGYIHFARENHAKAIEEFEEALNRKIKTTHDQAMINCNLSSLYLKTGDKDKAIMKLDAAKKLKHKKMLDSDIEALEKQLV